MGKSLKWSRSYGSLNAVDTSVPYLGAYGFQAHRYKKPLTDEQKADLRAKYLAGAKVKELSIEFKISVVSIRKQLGHVYDSTRDTRGKKPRQKKERKRESRNLDKIFGNEDRTERPTWNVKTGWLD
jgi:hypothetical protein